jgi:hypothetical protein
MWMSTGFLVPWKTWVCSASRSLSSSDRFVDLTLGNHTQQLDLHGFFLAGRELLYNRKCGKFNAELAANGI